MNTNKKFSPFIIATFAFLFGIYAQSYELFSPAILLIALALLTPVLLISATKNFYSKFTQVFACIIFFALGAFALTWQKNQYANAIQEFDGRKLDLIAQVTNKILLPTAEHDNWNSGKDDNRNGGWKEIIEITVLQAKDAIAKNHEAFNTAICYKKALFNLQCYSYSATDIQVDDIIELENVKIKVLQDKSLSQNTSYKNYLIKENLLSSVFFYKNKNITILKSPKFSIRKFIWDIQANTYQRLEQKIHPTVFTYFSLMFLGNTHHKNIDSMRNTFNYWGLSHYLARSGLHIVLFILIWTIFLQLIPISIRFKRSLLIIICVTYKIFSWTSLPFTRAFYAFILTEIGKIFNFQTDFLHLLSIVCMTILLFNPMQLFFLDFQLTFALTFALAFVSKFM
ncbi:MAG: ComEC/Rec2 family competence protein [bacterium]